MHAYCLAALGVSLPSVATRMSRHQRRNVLPRDSAASAEDESPLSLRLASAEMSFYCFVKHALHIWNRLHVHIATHSKHIPDVLF